MSPKNFYYQGYSLEKVVLVAIRLMLIIDFLRYVLIYNLENLLITASLFGLTYIPSIITKSFNINLIPEFSIIIQLFIFSSIYLGTLRRFYNSFWWWDSLLHGLSGYLFGFIGFIIFQFLYYKYTFNFKVRPLLIVLFTFSFSVSCGGLWEIFEFTSDSLFNSQMQKFGLNDTMWDLILDSIGAIFTSIIVFRYLYFNKKTYFIKLCNKFIDSNKTLTTKAH